MLEFNSSLKESLGYIQIILTTQINQDLCTRFAVQYYPTFLWACPPTLAHGDCITKAEELDELKNVHLAEKLLEWINERVAEYVLESYV